MGVGEYQNPKNLSEKTKQEFKKLIEKFQKAHTTKTFFIF